ncbi:MAG: hypothetical protein WBB00_07905 [Mycobacterium sp.]
MGKHTWNRMTDEEPGAVHMHSFWLARANDTDLKPLWLRVVALAYGAQKMNGHAHYGKGWIAEFFGKSPSAVCNAIADAIRYGMLDPASNSRCLVVPEQVRGGKGSAYDRCPEHWEQPKPNLRLLHE